VGKRKPIYLNPHREHLIMDGVLGTDYLLRGPLTLDLRIVAP